MIRPQICIGMFAIVIGFLSSNAAATAADTISVQDMQKVVKKSFEGKKKYQKGDLISQDDVKAALKSLETAGWAPADSKQIIADTLPASDFLVKELSDTRGRRFMRQVSGYKLIYDRLDRLAREAGGQTMLKAVLNLPDGYRYAAYPTRPEIPDLVDFLPKRGNSRTRVVKDYDKPTGRIYTEEDLMERLTASLKKQNKKGR